jgi:hypothetical protein
MDTAYIKRIIKALLTYLLALSCKSFAYDSTLIFASEVIRHGDRTPMEDVLSPTHQWPGGMAALTARGLHQEFELGGQLRKIYIDQYKLLPEHYEQNLFYVRSTDTNRSLNSAQAFLQGFYPEGTGPQLEDEDGPALPHNLQLIPVHSESQQYDKLLKHHKANPKKFEKLKEELVFSANSWQEANDAAKPFCKYLTEILNIKIKDIIDIKKIGDTIDVRILHHVPLPEKLTSEDIKKILEYREFVSSQLLRPHKIGLFIAKRLLQAEYDYMQDVVKNKTPAPRFVLYSAHDTNLLGIMSALRVPLEYHPAYASHISFQLFQENNSYYVKILLNGELITIPECAGNNTYSCTLGEFGRMFKI